LELTFSLIIQAFLETEFPDLSVESIPKNIQMAILSFKKKTRKVSFDGPLSNGGYGNIGTKL